MDPVTACDILVSYLKQSNLNFHLVESPFTARIEIRKTFIKDKSGNYRTSGLATYSTSSELFEEEKKVFMANQDALVIEKEVLQNKLLGCQEHLASLKVDMKQLQINQTILEKNKDDLDHALEEKDLEIDLLKKSLMNQEAINNATKHKLDQSKKALKAKEEEIVMLSTDVENLSTNCEALRAELFNKNIEHAEKVATKDRELGEAFEEKVNLEEKLNSLLDILYGCHGCGLVNCECDEDEADPDSNDKSSPQRPTPHSSRSPSPEVQYPLPPGKCSPSSWTPPPTPPCESCGGVNFGPSPGSLCFVCIPPLQSKAPSSSSSPSRTPPGTPPNMRLKIINSKNRL